MQAQGGRPGRRAQVRMVRDHQQLLGRLNTITLKVAERLEAIVLGEGPKEAQFLVTTEKEGISEVLESLTRPAQRLVNTARAVFGIKDDETPPDHVPLEDRLKGYQAEDDAEAQGENVVSMGKRRS